MTEAAPAPPRRRRRLSSFLLVALALIVLAGVAASRINLNEYVLSPGQAQSVGPLIKVPSDRAHPIVGAVLLTDVYLARVTLLDYLPDLLSSDNEMVTSDQLTGGLPSSELTAQGYLQMVQSKAAAKTAALRRLGYNVPEHDAGVVVLAVSQGTPAFGVLQVGQVITAVDGVTTATGCGFSRQLASFAPGQSVRLSVQQDHFSASGALIVGRVVQKSLRLAARPAGLPAAVGCPPGPAARGFLGIGLETQQDFTYPFPITINTADIGGPSAGLAMTLGLINTLWGGHLTGGRHIAATGTIDASGNVGDVGGVPQKTLAVEQRRGDRLFRPRPRAGQRPLQGHPVPPCLRRELPGPGLVDPHLLGRKGPASPHELLIERIGADRASWVNEGSLPQLAPRS